MEKQEIREAGVFGVTVTVMTGSRLAEQLDVVLDYWKIDTANNETAALFAFRDDLKAQMRCH
jgi:hypothetical protein